MAVHLRGTFPSVHLSPLPRIHGRGRVDGFLIKRDLLYAISCAANHLIRGMKAVRDSRNSGRRLTVKARHTSSNEQTTQIQKPTPCAL